MDDEEILRILSDRDYKSRNRLVCRKCGSKDHVKLVNVRFADDYTPFNRGKKALCADCRKLYSKKK